SASRSGVREILRLWASFASTITWPPRSCRARIIWVTALWARPERLGPLPSSAAAAIVMLRLPRHALSSPCMQTERNLAIHQLLQSRHGAKLPYHPFPPVASVAQSRPSRPPHRRKRRSLENRRERHMSEDKTVLPQSRRDFFRSTALASAGAAAALMGG